MKIEVLVLKLSESECEFAQIAENILGECLNESDLIWKSENVYNTHEETLDAIISINLNLIQDLLTLNVIHIQKDFRFLEKNLKNDLEQTLTTQKMNTH